MVLTLWQDTCAGTSENLKKGGNADLWNKSKHAFCPKKYQERAEKSRNFQICDKITYFLGPTTKRPHIVSLFVKAGFENFAKSSNVPLIENLVTRKIGAIQLPRCVFASICHPQHCKRILDFQKIYLI